MRRLHVLVEQDEAVAQLVRAHGAFGDFAERHDRIFIAVALNQRLGPRKCCARGAPTASTSENRFGTFSTQSSTVTRAKACFLYRSTRGLNDLI